MKGHGVLFIHPRHFLRLYARIVNSEKAEALNIFLNNKLYAFYHKD